MKVVSVAPSGIHGLGLFANQDFHADEVIMVLGGKPRVGPPTPYTLRLAENLHLDGEDFLVEDFLNHSSEPNCRIDLAILCLVAVRRIVQGDELTIDYSETEGHDFRQQQWWIEKAVETTMQPMSL